MSRLYGISSDTSHIVRPRACNTNMSDPLNYVTNVGRVDHIPTPTMSSFDSWIENHCQLSPGDVHSPRLVPGPISHKRNTKRVCVKCGLELRIEEPRRTRFNCTAALDLADLQKNLLHLDQRNISVVVNNLATEYILTKIQPLARYARGSTQPGSYPTHQIQTVLCPPCNCAHHQVSQLLFQVVLRAIYPEYPFIHILGRSRSNTYSP